MEYHSEGDRPVFRLGILSEDFSALNKSQVGVELLLKDRLVPYSVGPVQMVANREDDMAGLAIDTQECQPRQFVRRTLAILHPRTPHARPFG